MDLAAVAVGVAVAITPELVLVPTEEQMELHLEQEQMLLPIQVQVGAELAALLFQAATVVPVIAELNIGHKEKRKINGTFC